MTQESFKEDQQLPISEIERPFAKSAVLSSGKGVFLPQKRAAVEFCSTRRFEDKTYVKFGFFVPANVQILFEWRTNQRNNQREEKSNESITHLAWEIFEGDKVYIGEDCFELIKLINPLNQNPQAIVRYSSAQPFEDIHVVDITGGARKLETLIQQANTEPQIVEKKTRIDRQNKNIRPEPRETGLPIHELFERWRREIVEIENWLNSKPTVGRLVDIIRSVNLRAKISRVRKNQYPDLGFDDWEKRWYQIKYQAIMQAILKRHDGQKEILISQNQIDHENSKFRERLVFIFLTNPRPYKTETALFNLETVIPRTQLMSLIGEFDRLPRFSRKQRKFYP